MKGLVFLGLTALALATAPLAAQEPQDTHPPAGVVVREEAGARLLEANVPGLLLDWAALDRGDGTREIYILATTEDDPTERRSLYRVDLEPPRLVVLAADLAKEFDRLAAIDAQGEVGPELLLGRPGRIFRAELAGSAETPETLEVTRVASAPGLDLGSDLPVRGGPKRPGVLNLPSAGRVRQFTRDGLGDWQLESRTPLVTRASRHRHGLRLTTPKSTLMEVDDGMVLAVGPEAVGTYRLRSLLKPATEGTTAAGEVWSRLPGSERVQWSWFHVLDGRPVLLVTTNSADKLGVLERQQLRLFSLYGDRTQAGVGPWLTAKTTSRRWQQVEPFVADIDGDGDDDLVVAQIDGLGSGKAQFEAFVNTGRRSFEAKSRTSTLERESATWHFGSDLTGDGLADLVLLTEGELEVYAMLPAGSRRLIDRRPVWAFTGADIARAEHSVTVGTGGVAVSDDRPSRTGRPEVLDLDGDGRGELILAENPEWGFGRLRVVFLPPVP